MESAPRTPFPACIGLFALAALAGCGGGGGGGSSFAGAVGVEVEKPSGGSFFLDPHRAGTASRLELLEVRWGRLVDVHDVDELGRAGAVPVFRDVLVDENRLTDNVDYRLETNPITYQTRLVILRTRGAPDAGSGTFTSLLNAARSGLPAVLPRSPNGLGTPSLVPRNAALSLRFDDLLADTPAAERLLSETVQLLVGYGQLTPAEVRLRFDPNHGGLFGGRFHSTRVLVDLSVSEAEAATASTSLRVNLLGLPASQPGRPDPNARLRIPTQPDPVLGPMEVLRGVGGAPLAPVAGSAAGEPVERAFRTGNEQDLNQGFLLDTERPRIIGGWPVTVLDVRPDPAEPEGLLVDLRFDTPCGAAPRATDILQVGAHYLEVAVAGASPATTGEVYGVRVVILAGPGFASPRELVGGGLFLTPFGSSRSVPGGCWVSVSPAPAEPPAIGLATASRFQVRFSEPMRPETVRAFDTLRLVRAAPGIVPTPQDLVIADVIASEDLRAFTLRPRVPLDNRPGNRYRIELDGTQEEVLDFAGNSLDGLIADIVYTLDPGEPPQRNGGFALRFSSKDELEPMGYEDFRGQAVWEEPRGVLRGRDVVSYSAPVDTGQGLVSVMTPFPPGVQTPLSPFGSKVHAIWRYADLGWFVEDETRYNIDVVGMSWSPNLDNVIADWFPEFEMRLGHCAQIPDDAFTPAYGAFYPYSGLVDKGQPYEDNFLADPLDPRTVVHPAQRGYRIRAVDQYANANGTPLVPFPMNRGPEEPITYTWRDTTILAKGGNFGLGVPLTNEINPPFSRPGNVGDFASAGNVPSVALPLLWEILCFPSSGGIGQNAFRIMIPTDRYRQPLFRNFSTGGYDTNNQPVNIDPRREVEATGGYNPTSSPPGQRTMFVADNTFYIGQLDFVTRVSRTHTMWIDVSGLEKTILPPVFEPARIDWPAGTDIRVDYRGAMGFQGNAISPFDAGQFDAYGDYEGGAPVFSTGKPAWSDDPNLFDTAPYLQLRFSLVGDMETLEVPRLDSFGLAWIEE